MSRIIELPDKIYTKLVKTAQKSGTTPADWIAAQLPKRRKGNGQTILEAKDIHKISLANARLWKHSVSLGIATGVDNEAIDADLAREYGDDHAHYYQAEPKI